MVYLIKVSAILFIFYACYKFFLERETFFESNRWFLLVGLIMAFCIPLVTIPIYVTKLAPETTGMVITDGLQAVSSTQAENSFLTEILIPLYLIGVVIFTLKFCLHVASLLHLIIKNEKFRSDQYTHVKIRVNISPFSFFNFIVYNPNQYNDEDLQYIIAHEKVHANQLHSIDILFTHIATILNWFNPLFWFYRKELQQNLEFIADHEAQKQSECEKTYQHLLLKSTVPNYKMALANNFYNSLIKKRIVMLHKNRSKNRNQWKIAIVLPLLALFLMSFNTKEFITYETPDYEMASETVTDLVGDAEIIMIKASMSEDELKDITKKLAKQGITLKFKGVKRNNDNEITSIEVSVKTKSSSATHRSSTESPIEPIKIVIKDNNSISISSGEDTGHRDFMFRTKDGEHEIHTTKSGSSIFIHSDEVDHDDDHEIHEDDAKIIIKSGGTVHEVKKIMKGKNSIFISDDDDGEHEIIEIIGDDDDKGKKIVIRDGKKIVIKKDKDGNILNEWIEKDGDNVWISGDHDGKVFKLGKGKNKVFISGDADAKPLFILDGKEVSKEVIDDLDSEKIEKMEVLKGDSATKKYGDKGKDGVILITTKDN
jgi:TonB-dependent SusC/RagA subfamily outer membrane receptor